jgi:hypothetical protein
VRVPGRPGLPLELRRAGQSWWRLVEQLGVAGRPGILLPGTQGRRSEQLVVKGAFGGYWEARAALGAQGSRAEQVELSGEGRGCWEATAALGAQGGRAELVELSGADGGC